MPGGQFSHFRDKMSLSRDMGHRGSIPGRSRPFQDGWQAYFQITQVIIPVVFKKDVLHLGILNWAALCNAAMILS